MLERLFDKSFNYNLELFTDNGMFNAKGKIKEIGKNYILFNCSSIERDKNSKDKKEEQFNFLFKITENSSENSSDIEIPQDKKEE